MVLLFVKPTETLSSHSQVELPREDRCSLISYRIVPPSPIRSQTSASGFSIYSDNPDSDLDSCSSKSADYTLALAGLRGSVSQGDRCYAWPLAKDIEREYEWERGEYASSKDSNRNEGLIFDDGACPVGVSFVLFSVSVCT